MLETVADVQWQLHPQPEWNSEDTVCRALRALAAASDETGWAAYDRVLFAVGNNHAGTYFPVVLPVIPFLGEILRDGSSVARAWTLEVLIDLLCFDPDPGFDTVETSAGLRPLVDLVHKEIEKLTELVIWTGAEGQTPAERRLAAEFLASLSDEE